MRSQIQQALNQRNPNSPMMQFKQMYGLIRNSNNPMAMVQQIAMNNPRFRQALQQAQNYVNQCGGNPQQALNNYIQQSGIDLNMFR